jgi:hypothetical protein
MQQVEFQMQSYAANGILKKAKTVNWYTRAQRQDVPQHTQA